MTEKDEIVRIGNNMKLLRDLRNLTQQELADALDIKRSNIGAYEEGRATPKYDSIQKIATFFGVTLDMLIKEDLSQFSAEELTNHREQRRMDLEGRKLRVLPITVDNEGRENVELVPVTAAAGYLNGYADSTFIQNLPKFRLPMLGSGTFRAFEIKGDSMLPLKSGTVVIGEYIQDWRRDLKDGQPCIVVSQADGIVYKRVYSNFNNEGGSLRLKSDNPAYPPYEVDIMHVKEIWRAKMYLSKEFPEPDITIERISSIVMELQQEVIKMKGR